MRSGAGSGLVVVPIRPPNFAAGAHRARFLGKGAYYSRARPQVNQSPACGRPQKRLMGGPMGFDSERPIAPDGSLAGWLEAGLDAAAFLFLPILVLAPRGLAALAAIAGAMAAGLVLARRSAVFPSPPVRGEREKDARLRLPHIVIPAKAGIHARRAVTRSWTRGAPGKAQLDRTRFSPAPLRCSPRWRRGDWFRRCGRSSRGGACRWRGAFPACSPPRLRSPRPAARSRRRGD